MIAYNFIAADGTRYDNVTDPQQQANLIASGASALDASGKFIQPTFSAGTYQLPGGPSLPINIPGSPLPVNVTNQGTQLPGPPATAAGALPFNLNPKKVAIGLFIVWLLWR